MENFKVSVTKNDITKAMTTSDKLLDARLVRTNGILSKAIVPIARLLSEFGEKKSHPTEYYLTGLNSSFNSRIQLPESNKERSCLDSCK